MASKPKKCRCTAPINTTTGQCIYNCPPPGPRRRDIVGVKQKRETLISYDAVAKGMMWDRQFRANREKGIERARKRRAS